MAKPAVKARTATSAPGNSLAARSLHGRRPGCARCGATRGFTLIELMLVVALIAIASALAALALRDPAAARLDQEAARLTALLEGARAEARARGLTVTWQPVLKDGTKPDAGDFRFDGLRGAGTMPRHWLADGVVAEVVGATALVLGPEPMIGPQRVVLRLDDQRLAIATDGLGPFATVLEGEAGTPR